jgi:hypothetical protein
MTAVYQHDLQASSSIKNISLNNKLQKNMKSLQHVYTTDKKLTRSEFA